MTILYMARVARYDLLTPVTYLASRITKWSRGCDRKLHRLMCYIETSQDYVLEGYVGDKLDDVRLTLYSDAAFAGCKITMRSTSGVFLVLTGPNTFFPFTAVSRKQTCASRSTTEAEMVAANLALRQVGLPAQILLNTLLGRDVPLVLKEDNTATIQIMLSGKTPNLRHVSRTHSINLCWIHERIAGDVGRYARIFVGYC